MLLYELLTGTTPLRRERATGAGLLEFLRAVREEEPPRPSARLSAAAELPAIAADRGVEPRRLVGQVRGDLDWIVMKCLEKDRARRYETADGLARDVERHLRDEPVEASPARRPATGCGSSPAGTGRRWPRRRRSGCSCSAGAAVSTWQAVRATAEHDARRRRRQAEAEQREQAVAEKDRADEEAADRPGRRGLPAQGPARPGRHRQPGRGRRPEPERHRPRATRPGGRRIEGRFRGQERTEAAIRHTIGRRLPRRWGSTRRR